MLNIHEDNQPYINFIVHAYFVSELNFLGFFVGTLIILCDIIYFGWLYF